MRRAALRHPKTVTLAALLGVPRTHAVGILECLFDWAADMAPQGNIGKWPNVAIAGSLDWHGDADAFVAALMQAGFLRESAEHRLLINDWHEHCENWVRSKLKATGLSFLTLKDGLKMGDDPHHPLPSLPFPSLSSSGGTGPSGPSDDLLGGHQGPAECPHKEIIALYHQLMPLNPKVRAWTEPRKRSLQARWKQDAKRQTLDWWRSFFEFCADSEFLTGRTKPGPGREQPFLADLEWILKEANFVKILERKYHRETA